MPLLRAGLMAAGFRPTYYMSIGGTGSYLSSSYDSTNKLNYTTSNLFSPDGLYAFNQFGFLNYVRNIVGVSGAFPIWNGVVGDSTQKTYMVCANTLTSPTRVIGLLQNNNSAGQTIFTKQVVGTYATLPYAEFNDVKLDSTEAPIVCGYYAETTSTSYYRGLIVKFDSSGNVTWQKDLSRTTTTIKAAALAIDSSNNIYTAINQTTNNAGGCVVKHDSSGTLQWQREILTNTPTYTDVCVDSSGNVIVCGSYISSGDTYGFVAKYNSSGTLQWQRSYVDNNTAGSKNTVFNTVASDSSDNIYLAGKLKNTSGGFHMSIVKYNSSGTLQWEKEISDSRTVTTSNSFASEISIDGNSIIISGSVGTTLNTFGQRFLTSLPTDGTLTGVYTLSANVTLTYASVTNTSATSTLTDSAGALTAATGTSVIGDLTIDTINNTASTQKINQIGL
jgi:hypothetical protein